MLSATRQLFLILALSTALRCLLILLGCWQDSVSTVKYTDIDYKVYTDAARLVVAGKSPYDRTTFRYTPLLAQLMVGNILLTPVWGKLVFSAGDILTAWLINVLLEKESVPDTHRLLSTALWLFNPFTATISTRGNGESLVIAMLLLLLLSLLHGQIVVAGAVFGLVMHWRLYPVIYGLPCLLFLSNTGGRRTPSQQGMTSPCTEGKGPPPPGWLTRTVAYSLPINRNQLTFAAVSSAVFTALGALCYAAYGNRFIQEAYLYHMTRRDPRHNFSPHFLPMYLAHGQPKPADISWVAGASQAVVLSFIGMKYCRHLPFSMLLQTLAFVAFNKVSTAQYFVWYFGLLPLVTPHLSSFLKGRSAYAAAAWVTSQLGWLACAYRLEMQGQPVHLAVWACSIAFLAANTWVVTEIIWAFRPPVSFHDQGLRICSEAKQASVDMQPAGRACK